MKDLHPVFNWVGSKRHYVKRLEAFCPKMLTCNSTYFEPFLGSGSMLLHLQPHKAIVSDVDCVVTDTFRTLSKQSHLVSRTLRAYYSVDDRKKLYKALCMGFRELSVAERSAALIFISKHSFGSLMRYTTDGKRLYVNYRNAETGMNWENYERVAKYLRNNTIQVSCNSYQKTLLKAKKGDFCFLDPPYTIIKKNVPKEYYKSDMIISHELACIMNRLHDRGCFVLLINSKDDRLKGLLHNFEMYEFQATQHLSPNKTRSECIYVNYAL